MTLLTRRAVLAAGGATVTGIGAYSVNGSRGNETSHQSVGAQENDSDRSADTGASASTAPRLTLTVPDQVSVIPDETVAVEFGIHNEGDAPCEETIALRFLEGLPAELELADRYGDGATWEPQSTPGATADGFVWQAAAFDGGFAPGQRLSPELGFYAPASSERGTSSVTAALIVGENFDQEQVTIAIRE
ncbi:hypothetical protein [Natrinema sp. 1APR25-10V2]|uniref:hypothetical protein n=1 Tax=Natrinema sp. 1APR25-10V2 TaxID=2951081 RepID=UPI002874FFCE|nr:hypothetical protein [Natrinema sp. 1APR25-10V2]MDS0476817.1 hypothetical protein [Natrinema sp. 1APR25-10V2]